MAITISYILTVYNKENYLENTLASLRSQSGNFEKEFIFVDDCSTDNSVELIKQETKGWNNVKIIRNGENKGPSIRLNQGVQYATGKYLYLLDSDDIIPTNSAARMLEILEEEKADLIYGKNVKIINTDEYLNKSIPKDEPFIVFNTPLASIMNITNNKFVRMGQITTRNLFLKSGGCDERIFIQDVSLAIRLFAKAQKFIDYDATVLFYSVGGTNKISNNKIQEQHDALLAYYYALQDIKLLPVRIKKALQRKIIISAWRTIRNTIKYPHFSKLYADYRHYRRHAYILYAERHNFV